MPPVRERSAARITPQTSLSRAPLAVPGSTFLLIGLTIAGAVLRLLHLGAKSLFLDEPATVFIARLPWPHFKQVWWYGEASYQGAYFLLMRGWLHFGQSEFWIRLPAAIFAIASIPLIYAVARRLAGEPAGLASAALLAFSSTDVYYSQDARGYTLAILLVLASAWFFVRAVQQNRERDWLLWVAVSALAFYSHFFACFALAAQGCSLIVLRKTAIWRRVFLHGVLLLALAAPGLSFPFRVHTAHFPWMPTATPRQLLHLAAFFAGSGDKLLLSAILWVAAIIAIGRQRKNAADPEAFWRGSLLLSWAVIPVLCMALISLFNPVFVQRYMIFCLPATLMLAARGMVALPKHHLGVALVGLLCISSIVNIFLGYRKPREDWRDATAAVLSSAQRGDAVAVFPNFARPGFDYYYDRDRNATPVRLFATFYDTGESDRQFLNLLDSDPGAFHHVWVLLRDESDGQANLRDYAPDVAARLQSIFGPPTAQHFRGITLLKFGH